MPQLTTQESFGDIRSLVQKGADPNNWSALTSLLDELEIDAYFEDVILPYLEQHFESSSWSMFSPAAPRAWMLQKNLRGPRLGLFRLIRHIELRNRRLTSVGVERLINNPHLCRLRYLNLEDCSIGDDGASIISKAKHLHTLETLILSCSRVGSVGLDALLQAEHFTSLHTLDLSYSFFHDYAPGTSYLPLLSSLHTLKIRHGSIRPGALMQLLESPLLRNVKHLDLSGNQFTDEVAECLISLPWISNLESLDLSYTELTQRGIALFLEEERLTEPVRASVRGWHVS